MTKSTIYSLLNNSRFYVLATSLLLSVAIFGFLRTHIASDQLFFIRTQQVYGLIAVLFWYAALVISPIGYVIGKHRMKKIEFARRAIGVSAFYFVVLHGCIAIWGQLGGLSELQYLPVLFKWSLLGGFIAFFVLLIMAVTSFDTVVKYMTYRKWKWLHRLVYIAGVLAVLHIWMIGTHLAYGGVQLAAFIALVILSGLELYRTNTLLNNKYFHLDATEKYTLFITSWVLISLLIVATPSLIENYHSRHTDHNDATHAEARL